MLTRGARARTGTYHVYKSRGKDTIKDYERKENVQHHSEEREITMHGK